MVVKQAIIINEDLGMSKGKTAAQAAHASLNVYLKSGSDVRKEWKKNGQTKIVLKASEKDFPELMAEAERLNIPYYKVNDAGRTEVDPGSSTAIGIGPDKASKIDKVTGELKLVS